MARFNLYEQQTSSSTPRASADMFGAGVGKAVQGLGDTVADIGFRVQRREELAASDALRQELDTWAVPALDDFSKRHDINSPQALNEFQSALQQKKQELVNRFGGSSEARASLDRELGNQIYQYGKSAITTKIKAGHEVLARTVNQIIDTGVNQVMTAPETMDDVIAQNVFEVTYRKDGMDAAMYQNAMRIAQAAPLEAAVRAHLANGNIGEAEKIMKDSRFNEYVGPDQARPLRIDAAVGSAKMVAEKKRQDAAVVVMSRIIGAPLTPEQEAVVRALPPKKDMTPADEIAQLEMIQKKPATPDQVSKIFGAYTDSSTSGGMFGNSLRGRAVDFITQNAVAYANRMMTSDQERQFQAAITEAYSPVKITDPLTGQITTREVPMPDFVKSALARGGSFTTPSPAQAAPSAPGVPGAGAGRGFAQQTEPQPGQTIQLDINGQPVGRAQVDDTGRWSMPAPPEQQQAAPGLYDNVPFVTGPTAKLGQKLAETPLIGGDLGLDPRYSTAQKAMDIGRDQLSQALRPQTKIADQYRQELMDLVDISGKTWDNDIAMYRRLQTIDKELRLKRNELQKIADGKTAAPMEDRRDALSIMNAIDFSLQRLDVPQIRVNTREEVMKLPSGTRFIYGDDPKPQIRK